MAGKFEHLRAPEGRRATRNYSLALGRGDRRVAEWLVCGHRVQRTHATFAATRWWITQGVGGIESRSRHISDPAKSWGEIRPPNHFFGRFARRTGCRGKRVEDLGTRHARQSAYLEKSQ